MPLADLNYHGMAQDLATNLATANKNIDTLVSALNLMAMAIHANHGGNVCQPGDTWQECRHPTCTIAQAAFERINSD